MRRIPRIAEYLNRFLLREAAKETQQRTRLTPQEGRVSMFSSGAIRNRRKPGCEILLRRIGRRCLRGGRTGRLNGLRGQALDFLCFQARSYNRTSRILPEK